jgi:hypothetical protein
MTDHYPRSVSEMLAVANQIVAHDEARAALLRVPQEPWPDDGSLPRASHLRLDEDTTEWRGEANGVIAQCHAKPDVVLYVKPIVEADRYHTQLVDAAGVIHAWAVGRPW